MAANAQAGARVAVGLGGAALTTGRNLTGMANSAQNARIAMLDITHVGINMTQMLASGVNPMRALVAESGRLATAIQFSGGGIKGLIGNFAGLVGAIKTTQDAELTEQAVNARAAAEAIGAAERRAAANIATADTELALAEAAVRNAATSAELTAAQARLAAAHKAVTVAADEAAIAETALATASARAAKAEAEAAATSVTTTTGVGVALGTAAVAAGLAAAAIMSVKDAAEQSDPSAQAFIATLGLTHKEVEKLKDVTVTWGDVARGTFDAVAKAAGTSGSQVKGFFREAFLETAQVGISAAQAILGAFAGMVKGVATLLQSSPAIAMGIINPSLAGLAGKGIGNAVEDAVAQARKTFNDVGKFAHVTLPGAIDAARDKRLKDQADKIIGDRTPKKGPKDKKAPDPFGLEEFGRDAADRLKSLAEGFVTMPSQVEKVNKALRQLDDLVDDIQHKKPPNMKELLADAERVRQLIQDGLNKPFNDFILAQNRSLQVERLIAQGRQDEADALGMIQKLEQEMGPLTEKQKDEVLATVQAMKEQARQAEILRQKQQKYVELVASVKSAFEDIFTQGFKGLEDLPKKLIAAVAKLKAEKLFEGLFGDSFRDLEDRANGIHHADDASQRMAVAVEDATAAQQRGTDALNALTSSATKAAGALAGVSGSSRYPVRADGSDPLAPLPDGMTAPGDQSPIVVTGSRPTDLPTILQKLAKGVGISDTAAQKIGSITGKAVGGAATGAMVDSFIKPLGKMLGFKTSAMGAQIGGAIGSFLPIPGGDIIGSIVGSVIGGLFKKTKSGSSTITSVYGDVSSQGDFKDATSGIAKSVQGSLMSIAQTLGAQLGSFAVSIGEYKGKYIVDPTGQGRTHGANTPSYKTPEEAAAAAILDAIKDGAIKGLSDAVEKALKSSDDLDAALREALKVQQLEDLLGGVGGSLSRIFKQFDTEAADRVRLAKTYGLDVIAVEKLNEEQRVKLLDDILKQRLGALQDLQKSLLYGDLFEGDAGTRRNAILDEIAKVTKDAQAGVEGATDQLAGLYQQLLQTSREAYGTAGPEYSTDRELVTSGIDSIIQTEKDRIQAAADYQNASLALHNETNDLLSGTNGRLDTLIGLVGGGVGAPAVDTSGSAYSAPSGGTFRSSDLGRAVRN
jgi:hypothetical protein